MRLFRGRLSTCLTRRVWLLPLLAAGAVHFAGLFGAFVYDDVPLIAEHPVLSRGALAPEIWTRDYGLEFAGVPKGYYRPVFMMLVSGLRSVFGPSPFAFHLFSLCSFLTATALVSLVTLRAAPGARWVAVIAGMLYAVHPARVETVSLFMSLPDLLVEIGGLLVILALSRRPATSAASSSPWRTAAIGAGIALTAALCKESAFFCFAPLAVTAGVYGLYHRDHRPLVAWLVPAAGIVLGLAAALLPRWMAGIQAPLSVLEITVNLWRQRSIPALRTLALMVKEVIIPGPVVFWRQLPGAASITAAGAVLSIMVLLGLFWIWMIRSRRPVAALVTGWVGGNAVSVILLIGAGYPYSQRYLAVAPLLILVCLAGRHLAGLPACGVDSGKHKTAPGLSRPLAACMALYLVLHGAYALRGVLQCWSPPGFFLAMQKANPRDVVPLGAVAESLNKSGAPAGEVESCVRRATLLDPTHPEVALLHNMMIKRHLDDGSYQNALRFADWSLEFFPDDRDKRCLRAVALAGQGRYDEALNAIGQVILAAPGNQTYRLLEAQIRDNRARAQSRESTE